MWPVVLFEKGTYRQWAVLRGCGDSPWDKNTGLGGRGCFTVCVSGAAVGRLRVRLLYLHVLRRGNTCNEAKERGTGLYFFYLFFIFCLFFAFSRAAPAAYGGSQSRGLIRAVAAKTTPQQRRIQTASATYTAAHGNAGSLTH